MGSFVERWNRTLSTFLRKGFVRGTLTTNSEGRRVGEETKLTPVLSLLDLVLFGIGITIGAGVFVLTGEAAKEFAGPSIILSYLVSSFIAILLAMSYAEFAVDYPVTGGGFTYVRLVYGEFLAWLTAISLLLEQTLGIATVSKGFSGYLASLCGLDTSTFVWDISILRIDPIAFVLISLFVLIVANGVKESSYFNMIVTGVNLLVILFILLASINKSDGDHFSPTFPEGLHGMFHASALIFFAYLGFESLANMAAEAKQPNRDLPLSIVGSVLICAALYMLMAAALIGLQAYDEIDDSAPFSEAFIAVGMRWAGKIVSIGALTGLVTSCLVTIIGQSRLYIALAAENFVPQWIGLVHEASGSPRNALKVIWISCGLLALLFDISFLAKLVSVGTIFVLSLVSIAAIQRTYMNLDEHQFVWPVHIRLILIVLFSILEGATFALDTHPAVYLTLIVLVVILALSFYVLPVQYTPAGFVTPLKPLTASLAVLGGVHLIFSLGWEAHTVFVCWQIVGILFYVYYGMYQTKEVALSPVLEVEIQRNSNIQEDSMLIHQQEERSDAVNSTKQSP